MGGCLTAALVLLSLKKAAGQLSYQQGNNAAHLEFSPGGRPFYLPALVNASQLNFRGDMPEEPGQAALGHATGLAEDITVDRQSG